MSLWLKLVNVRHPRPRVRRLSGGESPPVSWPQDLLWPRGLVLPGPGGQHWHRLLQRRAKCQEYQQHVKIDDVKVNFRLSAATGSAAGRALSATTEVVPSGMTLWMGPTPSGCPGCPSMRDHSYLNLKCHEVGHMSEYKFTTLKLI